MKLSQFTVGGGGLFLLFVLAILPELEPIWFPLSLVEVQTSEILSVWIQLLAQAFLIPLGWSECVSLSSTWQRVIGSSPILLPTWSR